jgi:hypothetical protein
MTGRFEADPGPFLRPYAMTEGRTEPSRAELAIEDLVTLPGGAGDPPPWLSLEHRSIALACRQTMSVGDLADHGMVTVHRAPSHAGGPTVALLEQVLHGLKQL